MAEARLMADGSPAIISWVAVFLTIFSWPVFLTFYALIRFVRERIELRKYIHG